MANYAEKLPKMLFGEELKEALTCLPEYDASIREADPGTRLLRLTDLYKVFLPGTMASEIYHKLYMMTSMSLSQKGTVASVRQLNANHKWMNGGEFHGVATGATSATVIGASGIGKSTCIRKAMDAGSFLSWVSMYAHSFFRRLERTAAHTSNNISASLSEQSANVVWSFT